MNDRNNYEKPHKCKILKGLIDYKDFVFFKFYLQ